LDGKKAKFGRSAAVHPSAKSVATENELGHTHPLVASKLTNNCFPSHHWKGQEKGHNEKGASNGAEYRERPTTKLAYVEPIEFSVDRGHNRHKICEYFP